MTEKEAIVFLDAIKRGLHQTGKDHPYRDDLIPKMKEALCIAIEEMKAEPCADAISRKWTLDVVNNFVFDTETDRNRIIHIVRDTAPSVTPKQKTLEWIELKDQKPEEYEDVLVKDIGGDVTCAHRLNELISGINFYEAFSGEIIDDVVEWREIPE